jgi:3-deoxy-7-phosphoheptulonate synthase
MKPSWQEQFSGYQCVKRTPECADSIVHVRDLAIGGADFVVMAGPCSVESERQLLETAEAVALAGARVLRGGAFKPRSSPYSFQGLGVEGLKLLAKARSLTGLAIVTEVILNSGWTPSISSTIRTSTLVRKVVQAIRSAA